MPSRIETCYLKIFRHLLAQEAGYAHTFFGKQIGKPLRMIGGSLYPTLRRMVEDGYFAIDVEAGTKAELGHTPRKFYKWTEIGWAQAQAFVEKHKDVVIDR